jgi:fumarylacetoacetate (FAA) hydrolase
VKLASLKSARDGRLHVVSRDLTRAADATHIARTLQQALDGWRELETPLREFAQRLENDATTAIAFRPEDCAAPLPRAYQWMDGSAYVNHVDLMRQSRGGSLPESFFAEPLLYQGGSDDLLGPRDPIVCADAAYGIDFEAELGIITDDVPMSVSSDDAASHIKLYTLLNDVSLRRLIPPELAKGFGFFQGKPATAFAAVAVTPDELNGVLSAYTIARPMLVHLNGGLFGRARPDVDQIFTFADLIAHACKTRKLGAGSILGGGTVSNRMDGGPGRSIEDGGDGYSCIAEQRAVERIATGRASTDFLQHSDRIRIEMLHADGSSIFGSIEQTVTILGGPQITQGQQWTT